MPTLTVQTGLDAGKRFDSVMDLLEHQETRRSTCPHKGHKRDSSGVSGMGIRKKEWKRTRCCDCNEVLDYKQNPIPDYRQQRDLDLEFMAELKPGDIFIEQKDPMTGNWHPVWSNTCEVHKMDLPHTLADYVDRTPLGRNTQRELRARVY